MDIDKLTKAIKKSGGREMACEQAEGLMVKLDLIKSTNRYGALLKDIASVNDESNFLALIFEAIFAFHFESVGIPLEYEVRQNSENNTSIDFLMRIAPKTNVYFEARLIQKNNETKDNIEKQIKDKGSYEIMFEGSEEESEIKRLQSVILSKVQKNGIPIKFLQVDDDTINIVAINVSGLILGMIDLFDCQLAVFGDSYVAEVHRRGIFGLFQKQNLGCSAEIESVINDFSHIRNTLSGILFLFKSPESEFLNYNLEHYMMWNPCMINDSRSKEIDSIIQMAIPIRESASL